MTATSKIALYAMTAKGVAVLKRLLLEFGPEAFEFVVTSSDKEVEYDGSEDIRRLTTEFGIPIYSRTSFPNKSDRATAFAVSWRWLISDESSQKVVVLHDSLLPKYRGFSPLVSALINKEPQIGVTALIADEEYDSGPIIAQEHINVSYPITIEEAIEQIIPCYERIAVKVGSMILGGLYSSVPQDKTKVTYSLWRDDDDYLINWEWDAAKIRRFVDATGYPYKGALTLLAGKRLRLLQCQEMEDVSIENRNPGKVIFMRDGKPVVVCGSGLLQIQHLIYEESQETALPLKKFRAKFGF